MRHTGPTAQAIGRTAHIVQVAFPQVYLACHTRHERKRSNPHELSARDAAILAHLDKQTSIAPSRLAAHLGLARSTLSEALKRLEALGFVRPPNGPTGGGRRSSVFLSSLGAEAIRDTSVLETPRLQAALGTASGPELRAIAAGMRLLAEVCRRRADAARAARRTPR
jgi:DNA-binding MarR family transcriptional regulator